SLLHGLIGAAGLVAMLWLVLRASADGSLGAAAAAALFFATVALLEVAAGAGLAWQALGAGLASLRRVRDIAGRAPTVADPATPVPVPEFGTLAFEDVRFAWPGAARPVLDGVSFVLRPGERIAIGGDSGAGKSTFSSLLLRLWDPQAGRVRYGGVDLRDVAQDAWHARIAWLPQNAPVFAGSVRENLALGAPDADDARMWRALAAVRLDRAVEALGGLDAWVGENGATLSAGQGRRLALARALLREAPILLLDEPTEGLDQDTAHALLHDLVAALDGRSLVMITHDLLPPGIVERRYRLQDGRLHEPPHPQERPPATPP
ncbi:amino acid ABC transporter ATP-binding/permease protein, partial [Coralloluteibacterium stylophorae]